MAGSALRRLMAEYKRENRLFSLLAHFANVKLLHAVASSAVCRGAIMPQL